MTKLCVMPGDGIGLEVVPASVAVLKAVMPDLELVYADAGWGCFEKRGVSVPDETLALIRETGAGLFGAVSSPSRKVEGYRSTILTMRQALNLYANIRPVKSWPQVSPREGIDMIVVRENTEGLYSGRERMEGDTAVSERIITRHASEDQGHFAKVNVGNHDIFDATYRYGGNNGDLDYRVTLATVNDDGQDRADGNNAADDVNSGLIDYRLDYQVNTKNQITYSGSFGRTNQQAEASPRDNFRPERVVKDTNAHQYLRWDSTINKNHKGLSTTPFAQWSGHAMSLPSKTPYCQTRILP